MTRGKTVPDELAEIFFMLKIWWSTIELIKFNQFLCFLIAKGVENYAADYKCHPCKYSGVQNIETVFKSYARQVSISAFQCFALHCTCVTLCMY